MEFPDHGDQVSPELLDILERMHWRSARTVEAVAPHQYNVKGWDRDDVTEAEFWSVVDIVRAVGRVEEWTPPAGFYDSGNRRPMLNTYLYLGDHAYWFTQPRDRPAMLNRESVSVQLRSPTRRPPGTEPAFANDTPDHEQLELL
jgi:hypothetical protein